MGPKRKGEESGAVAASTAAEGLGSANGKGVNGVVKNGDKAGSKQPSSGNIASDSQNVQSTGGTSFKEKVKGKLARAVSPTKMGGTKAGKDVSGGANGASKEAKKRDSEVNGAAASAVPSPTGSTMSLSSGMSSLSSGGLAGMPPSSRAATTAVAPTPANGPPPPIPRHAFLENPLPTVGKAGEQKGPSAVTLGLGLYSLSNPHVKTPSGSVVPPGMHVPPNIAMHGKVSQLPLQPGQPSAGHFHPTDSLHPSHTCPNCARYSQTMALGTAGAPAGGQPVNLKGTRSFAEEMAGLGMGGGSSSGEENRPMFQKVSTSTFFAGSPSPEVSAAPAPAPAPRPVGTSMPPNMGWPFMNMFQAATGVPPPPALSMPPPVPTTIALAPSDGVPSFGEVSSDFNRASPAFLPNDWKVPISPRPVGLGTISFFNPSSTAPGSVSHTNSSGVAVPQLPLPIAPFSFRDGGPAATDLSRHPPPPSPPLWFPGTSGIPQGPTPSYSMPQPPPFALSPSPVPVPTSGFTRVGGTSSLSPNRQATVESPSSTPTYQSVSSSLATNPSFAASFNKPIKPMPKRRLAGSTPLLTSTPPLPLPPMPPQGLRGVLDGEGGSSSDDSGGEGKDGAGGAGGNGVGKGTTKKAGGKKKKKRTADRVFGPGGGGYDGENGVEGGVPEIGGAAGTGLTEERRFDFKRGADGEEKEVGNGGGARVAMRDAVGVSQLTAGAVMAEPHHHHVHHHHAVTAPPGGGMGANLGLVGVTLPTSGFDLAGVAGDGDVWDDPEEKEIDYTDVREIRDLPELLEDSEVERVKGGGSGKVGGGGTVDNGVGRGNVGHVPPAPPPGDVPTSSSKSKKKKKKKPGQNNENNPHPPHHPNQQQPHQQRTATPPPPPPPATPLDTFTKPLIPYRYRKARYSSSVKRDDWEEEG
ncbi:hypothetical protein HDV00_001493 [Rhizophlyctis rosea]|nr:hypothetical protein HDV00_001493 [Rhizophlyctis rosea]